MPAHAQEVVPAINDVDPQAPLGEMPYEMANRPAPAQPIVDFQDLSGWSVTCFNGAAAKLERSREQRLWAEYSAKLTFTGRQRDGYVELRPPHAVRITETPSAVKLWCYGNNWGWIEEPGLTRVRIYVLLKDARDELHVIPVGTVNFKYWFMMHAHLASPQQGGRNWQNTGGDQNGVIDAPVSFVGIRVTPIADEQPRPIYFGPLEVYQETWPSLELEPVPEKLPFPTTADTILPTLKAPCRNSAAKRGDVYVLTCDGDEKIEYLYKPTDGTLGDIRVRRGKFTFQPCAEGGIVVELSDSVCQPGDERLRRTLLSCDLRGDVVESLWRCGTDTDALEFSLRLRAKGKSLLVQLDCLGGKATELVFGHTAGTPEPQLIYVPYLTLGDLGPATVLTNGIFLEGLVDWYVSDGSELYSREAVISPSAARYNGGVRYLPKTDGRRNDLHERLFINISSDFQEVLPNIPNPKSDAGDIARHYLWRNIGFMRLEMLEEYKAYGIDGFIACHHEVTWRDGGESFTMRLESAPKNVGDERLREYGAAVRALGYRFGLYTNYSDFAPVSARWDDDSVCLLPDGQWRRAWPRCYAFKPTRAAEAEQWFAPRIHEKFGTDASYCDVHTAAAPWGRVDYDARVPGAGKFRAVFESYGRLLLNETKAHGGPAFSEGRLHWLYAGLVDGNYGQMRGAQRYRRPALVDFDLLKLHPLETDVGMGAPNMFYERRGGQWREDRSAHSPYFDRFIASTIAFGHIGYLTAEWGLPGTLKSYYLLRELQRRYAMVPVTQIRYNADGKLVDTSEALRTGAYRDSQVYVRYDSGLEVHANLSWDKDWEVRAGDRTYLLPPTGFVAYMPNELLEYSAAIDGRRVEYVDAPEYVYLDTRGQLLATDKLRTDGAVAVKRDEAEDAWWVIPATTASEVTIDAAAFGITPDAEELQVVAIAKDGSEADPPEVRRAGSRATIFPVEGAIKYRLSAEPLAAQPPLRIVADSETPMCVAAGVREINISLTSTTAQVLRDLAVGLEGHHIVGLTAPGEGLASLGPHDTLELSRSVRVAPEAAPGERIWVRVVARALSPDGPVSATTWVDFTVVPAIEIELIPSRLDAVRAGSRQELWMRVGNNTGNALDVEVALLGPDAWRIEPALRTVRVEPGRAETTAVRLTLPEGPAVQEFRMQARYGDYTVTQTRYMRTRSEEAELIDLRDRNIAFFAGMVLRGDTERELDGTSGASFRPDRLRSGGIERDGFFCHPPYRGAVGYTFAVFPLELPDEQIVLRFYTGLRDGSTSQDGVLFKVAIQDQRGAERELFSRLWHQLRWGKWAVDLSPFRGQRVRLKLICDVGPDDNSISDWACWGDVAVVAKEPRMTAEITQHRPTAPAVPARD